MKKCSYEEDIDAYLRGKLSESESAKFEEHYFNCPSCFEKTQERNELMEVMKHRGAFLLAPESGRQPEPKIAFGKKVAAFLTPRQWAAAAVAAALLVFVVWGIVPRLKDRGPEFVFTGDETVRGESLVLLAPLGSVKDAPAYFEWKALDAAEYQITLFGLETPWTETTSETRIALPDDVRNKLEAGRPYSWQVKAYSPQGILLAPSAKAPFTISN